MQQRLNYSRQREAILSNLTRRYDHPTAETVYADIRKSFPRISLGTVYRNLNVLADMGKVVRFSTGDGTDHFDARTTPHCHFICKHCGKIVDMELDALEDWVRTAREKTDAEIEDAMVSFYGVCRECREKEAAEKKALV